MADYREIDEGGVQGILQEPKGGANGNGCVLTHGAGADCHSVLLMKLAEWLVDQGFYVLRCNLAFRQRRRTGPPHPRKAEEDRFSLLTAAKFLRTYAPNELMMGGHSYGGRQATMLASEDKSVADRLLLFSYPLHPPAKPEQLRTAHLPKLKVPSIFVHGGQDPFGTPAEMTRALELIPAVTKLLIVEGAGHDLKRGCFDLGLLSPLLLGQRKSDDAPA